MNRSDLKKKVSVQWGALSKEHSMVRDIIKKAEKWEKYEYEKFGPAGMHKNEKHTTAPENNPGQPQQQKTSWIPNDKEIFRVTWSYLFARAGWILMAYIVMFGFMGIMFLVMYMMAK